MPMPQMYLRQGGSAGGRKVFKAQKQMNVKTIERRKDTNKVN